MIDVTHLTVRYGSVVALDDVSLQVPAGQFVLVSGPSGCGKSTLARALTGLIPHAIPAQVEGTVVVDSSSTRDLPVAALAARVGSVFQNPSAQLFHLRVADEVAFGPRNLGLAPAEVEARVAWALAATETAALRERQPSTLSGGQQQRVAIAAALAMRPDMLVLDEPTASLDPAGARLVLETVERLHKEAGMTIVLVEHRLAEIATIAERVLLLDEGRIVADGPPALLRDEALQARLGLRPPDQSAPPAWPALLEPRREPQRKPLLSLERVAAGYEGQPVLKNLSLSLYPGEFVALVGPNGSGKSTLALTLAGRLKPLAGEILVNRQGQMRSQRGLRGRKWRVRPGRDVGLLFQNPLEQLFTDSVGDEVSFGPRNFQTFDPAAHDDILQQADLQALARRHPTHLSLGQQQRTALAASLALQPRLLILDEPTMGQDWRHLRQLMDFVQRQVEAGTAVLLITHDQRLVADYAQRVLVLEDGQLCLDGILPEKMIRPDGRLSRRSPVAAAEEAGPGPDSWRGV